MQRLPEVIYLRFEENPRRVRLLCIYGFVVTAVLTLILRLSYLDIVMGKTLHEQAGKSFTASLGVLPNRGWIYDKDMRVLAYNAPSIDVILSRYGVNSETYPILAKRLAPVLHVDERALLRKMCANSGDKEVSLYDQASNRQVAYIAEHRSQLPGIQCVDDVHRVYTYGSLAGHILGYIQPQPAKDVSLYRAADYLPEQKVGVSGIERQYESTLAGRHGNRVWEVTSSGVPVNEEEIYQRAVAGQSIRLTLDVSLQAIAQQQVLKQIELVHAKLHIHPTDAEAVMLDTRTGGVLAMVSYPYYNPNWYVDAGAYEAHRSYIDNKRLTPIINHTLTSPRYPGSTVKPVNLLAAMASGAISPDTQISDEGKLMVGTYEAHDWVQSGHGIVDVPTAIQKSCDTYMYQVGMWMANWFGTVPPGQTLTEWNQRDRIVGLNRMLDLEWRFGLGPKTGIDLPGEAGGRFYANDSLKHVIVPYHLKQAEHQMQTKHVVPNAGLLYDNAFAAIGQMQEFTPLQLAVYAMTIADDGKRLRPHLLDAVLSEGSKETVRTVEPTVMDRVKIQPQDLQAVKTGMFRVVNRQGGTAYRAFLGAKYKAAGKTGTAEVSQWGHKTDISLFIGYAPAVRPQVAIAVMVPGGGESSDVAVPLARRLLDAYFAHKGKSTHQETSIVHDWMHSPAAIATESGHLP